MPPPNEEKKFKQVRNSFYKWSDSRFFQVNFFSCC